MANDSFSDLLNNGAGGAQSSQGVGAGAFVAALVAALVGFGVQLAVFLLINGRLARIYRPKTFLVPERERAPALSGGPWQWLLATLRASNSQYIQKCGLDAYFFLRYLRALLKISIPLLLLILPILLPINAVGGRGPHFAEGPYNTTSFTNVSGLDILAWGNIRPANSHRYWAHLILAYIVILWSCFVFFDELKGYVRLRQAHLTSPQHRLKASATTVLVTAIPAKWCTLEALAGLFDVYPGGIRNIWVNRNFDELSEKVKLRAKLAINLEKAETNLVQKALKAAAKKQAETKKKEKKRRRSSIEFREIAGTFTQKGLAMAQTDGVASGAPVGDSSPSIAQLDGEEDSARKHSSASEDPVDKVIEYPAAFDADLDQSQGSFTWQEYLKPDDRETQRLPVASWMFSLPLVGRKVDTIYWCREELARLNLEIELDQKNYERYPTMNSAFIQFNNQIAAHMACQSLSHHTPKKMSQRLVEMAPGDVIWDNMSSTWWATYLRVAATYTAIVVLIIGWAIPVTFTGSLSHLSALASVKGFHWVAHIPKAVLSIIQGIVPPLLLNLIFSLLPSILRLLARTQGKLTGVAVEVDVQRYYFAFLFVQLFLIVSISSGLTTIIPELASKPQSVASLLAENLPKASNYFFSYLLLQALGTSGSALLQLWPLAQWFLLAPLNDNTARQKWRRQMHLPNFNWGSFFPVYTNLACIGLIYSVISPLILIFNVICFGLFWLVYRYNTLFVTQFANDSGGLFFPTAINQLFTGVYVMEICLIGLFFLVRDARIVDGKAQPEGTPCKVQGILMIVALALTIIYQLLLNNAFEPLLRYLPITLEDEAVLRDEAFAKAAVHGRNRGVTSSLDVENAETSHLTKLPRPAIKRIPVLTQIRPKSWLQARQRAPKTHPGKLISEQEIATALFAGLSDEIEDLSPSERDLLIQQSFHHAALRARRPAVWIPRDPLGVSDDEIEQTRRFSDKIWITNAAAGLTAKGKVQYQQNPPDFSELDLITL